MAQINLLGSDSKAGGGILVGLPMLIVRTLVVLFLLLLVYWVFLFVQAKLTKNDISEIQQDIISVQNQILNNNDRKELLVRQGQTDAAKGLIDQHQYWSKLLPGLAKVTLGSARYLSLRTDGVGQASVVVNVPTYVEMDKYLQTFNQKEFNGVFQSVAVSSVSKVQQGDIQLVRFEVNLKYNPEFLLKTTNDQESLGILK